MFGLGLPDFIILATILMAGIVPAWLGARVAKKAGFHRAWSLLLLFIPLHVVLLWIFAFAPWPSLESKPDQRDDLTGAVPDAARRG